ncbi:MAG: PEP-CTERM sorting domain-containing protein [Armatimonadetes bacterium]|nr:PEP-CTERM sorting domain-containing protein [Armatimonadota bacterium]
MLKHTTALFALAACAVAHAGVWDSGSGLNWVIPDNNEQIFNFNVAGLSGTLTQIDVVFSREHTFSGDLYMDMTFADGTDVDMLENPGNAVANSGASSRHLKSIWFADAGANCDFWGTSASPAIDSESSGTVYAHSTAFLTTAYSSVSGNAALNGSYKLRVGDIAAQDVGVIDRIRIHTESVPEPATMAVLGLGALVAARRRAR